MVAVATLRHPFDGGQNRQTRDFILIGRCAGETALVDLRQR